MTSCLQKEVLTTGEVARLCHVAARTVSKWFDTGKLRGYRIPGSRDRRIPRQQVLAFMRAHGIPISDLDGGSCRVLVLGGADEPIWQALAQDGRHELRHAGNGFEAGVLALQFRPHVIVVFTAENPEEAAGICRNIKSSPQLGATKVLAADISSQPRSRQWYVESGFDDCLTGSLSLGALREAIQQATNLIT
jgi:excisionase family DNA binding protein